MQWIAIFTVALFIGEFIQAVISPIHNCLSKKIEVPEDYSENALDSFLLMEYPKYYDELAEAINYFMLDEREKSIDKLKLIESRNSSLNKRDIKLWMGVNFLLDNDYKNAEKSYSNILRNNVDELQLLLALKCNFLYNNDDTLSYKNLIFNIQKEKLGEILPEQLLLAYIFNNDYDATIKNIYTLDFVVNSDMFYRDIQYSVYEIAADYLLNKNNSAGFILALSRMRKLFPERFDLSRFTNYIGLINITENSLLKRVELQSKIDSLILSDKIEKKNLSEIIDFGLSIGSFESLRIALGVDSRKAEKLKETIKDCSLADSIFTHLYSPIYTTKNVKSVLWLSGKVESSGRLDFTMKYFLSVIHFDSLTGDWTIKSCKNFDGEELIGNQFWVYPVVFPNNNSGVYLFTTSSTSHYRHVYKYDYIRGFYELEIEDFGGNYHSENLFVSKGTKKSVEWSAEIQNECEANVVRKVSINRQYKINDSDDTLKFVSSIHNNPASEYFFSLNNTKLSLEKALNNSVTIENHELSDMDFISKFLNPDYSLCYIRSNVDDVFYNSHKYLQPSISALKFQFIHNDEFFNSDENEYYLMLVKRYSENVIQPLGFYRQKGGRFSRISKYKN